MTNFTLKQNASVEWSPGFQPTFVSYWPPRYINMPGVLIRSSAGGHPLCHELPGDMAEEAVRQQPGAHASDGRGQGCDCDRRWRHGGGLHRHLTQTGDHSLCTHSDCQEPSRVLLISTISPLNNP